MPDEGLLHRAADRLAEFERTGDFVPLLAHQARTDAYRLLADAAPAPDQVVLFGPVMLAFATFWYRATAGDRHPEAEQDAQTALGLRNFLRHLLPDPSTLPKLPPGIPETDHDPTALRAFFATIVGVACAVLAERGPGGQALLDQGMAWLVDVVPVLPADHVMFPGAAVALVALRVHRYRLAGDPDSLAAAAETATVACGTIRPDHPARGASLPMMLGVLVESAVVLGTPSPEEVSGSRSNPGSPGTGHWLSASGTRTSRGGWRQRSSRR